MSSPSVVVVSGNPRPGSRTLAAARAVAERLAALVPGDPGGPAAVEVVDLAALAGELLAPAHPAADAALARLASADLAVIATPVYKASYTGLLKAFLDLYRADGLAGVVAVPLVVSGSPAHALVELGAVVPARSLTLTEAQLGDLGPALDAWLVRAAAPLRRALGAAADVAPAADLAGAVR